MHRKNIRCFPSNPSYLQEFVQLGWFSSRVRVRAVRARQKCGWVELMLQFYFILMQVFRALPVCREVERLHEYGNYVIYYIALSINDIHAVAKAQANQ